MDFDLTTHVVTRGDVDALIRDIDILLDSLYRSGDNSFEHTIKNSVRSSTADLLKTIGNSRDKRKEVLESLKEKLLASSYITLTIAFDPPVETIKRIATWVRKNIDPEIVLNIKIDHAVIAGAIIEYAGRYMDMSVSKKLDAELQHT